jgi:hypothetical protein
LDEEEELFNLEENIVNPTTYNWEDKYRPRKPRYFNRVHTGYEWNKYNQTHYEYVSIRLVNSLHLIIVISTDNPPPKVVQGYKVRLDIFAKSSRGFIAMIFSSTYFILTSSTSRKHPRIRSLKSQGMTKQSSYILVLGLLMKTLRSEL